MYCYVSEYISIASCKAIRDSLRSRFHGVDSAGSQVLDSRFHLISGFQILKGLFYRVLDSLDLDFCITKSSVDWMLHKRERFNLDSIQQIESSGSDTISHMKH